MTVCKTCKSLAGDKQYFLQIPWHWRC